MSEDLTNNDDVVDEPANVAAVDPVAEESVASTTESSVILESTQTEESITPKKESAGEEPAIPTQDTTPVESAPLESITVSEPSNLDTENMPAINPILEESGAVTTSLPEPNEKPEAISETATVALPIPAKEDASAAAVAPSSYGFGVFQVPRTILLKLLEKARAAKEAKRRKKLDKIMTLFVKNPKGITNDMVEKLLHVSHNTATNYLAILVKEGKLVKTGEGSGTKYQENG